MIIPANTIVLDLETAHSADDCRYCGRPAEPHSIDESCCTGYEAIGWGNKPALGLSIGCYWDYQDSRIHWFDVHTLQATMQHFVDRQPLLVSFNGIRFDFPLMRGLVRQEAERLQALAPKVINSAECAAEAVRLITLCDTFKAQCAASYDILAEIRKIDPSNKIAKNLGSLSEANGLGAKLSHGSLAPRDWAAGRIADVMNYCQDDVLKTKGLFELACAGLHVRRMNAASLLLPQPLDVGGTDFSTVDALFEVL